MSIDKHLKKSNRTSNKHIKKQKKCKHLRNQIKITYWLLSILSLLTLVILYSLLNKSGISPEHSITQNFFIENHSLNPNKNNIGKILIFILSITIITGSIITGIFFKNIKTAILGSLIGTIISGVSFFVVEDLTIDFTPTYQSNDKSTTKIISTTKDTIITTPPFLKGKYTLTPAFDNLKNELKESMRNSRFVLVIGSTDKTEVKGILKSKIGSNFELASKRAKTISNLIQYESDSVHILETVKGGSEESTNNEHNDRCVKIYIRY